MEMFLIITVLLPTLVHLFQNSYRNAPDISISQYVLELSYRSHALKSEWKAGILKFTITKTEQHLTALLNQASVPFDLGSSYDCRKGQKPLCVWQV